MTFRYDPIEKFPSLTQLHHQIHRVSVLVGSLQVHNVPTKPRNNLGTQVNMQKEKSHTAKTIGPADKEYSSYI